VLAVNCGFLVHSFMPFSGKITCGRAMCVVRRRAIIKVVQLLIVLYYLNLPLHAYRCTSRQRRTATLCLFASCFGC